MGNCDARLSGKFARICGHKPKQGLVRKWYINWEDIDREATQTTNRGTKVELLVLKADAKIYPAEGNNKTSKANHAYNKADFGGGYIHTDNFTVMYRGERERERIQELVDGAKVVTIIEKVDGGLNGELAFELVGMESGMTVTEDTWSSSENSGTTLLTVATEEGEEELTGVKLFLQNTYTETLDFIKANEYGDPPAPPEQSR
ncbi:hypothetical protein ACFSTE_13320 [Aquimarina hainanensis]|uniref:Phage major tail protein, TP901-1 family n=1 Tax=Aquimarina hainanensis TaxID=1578017 RepID=A0ABW5NAF0_9FLAO